MKKKIRKSKNNNINKYLLENKNFRNNQNYIFSKTEILHNGDSLLKKILYIIFYILIFILGMLYFSLLYKLLLIFFILIVIISYFFLKSIIGKRIYIKIKPNRENNFLIINNENKK